MNEFALKIRDEILREVNQYLDHPPTPAQATEFFKLSTVQNEMELLDIVSKDNLLHYEGFVKETRTVQLSCPLVYLPEALARLVVYTYLSWRTNVEVCGQSTAGNKLVLHVSHKHLQLYFWLRTQHHEAVSRLYLGASSGYLNSYTESRETGILRIRDDEVRSQELVEERQLAAYVSDLYLGHMFDLRVRFLEDTSRDVWSASQHRGSAFGRAVTLLHAVLWEKDILTFRDVSTRPTVTYAYLHALLRLSRFHGSYEIVSDRLKHLIDSADLFGRVEIAKLFAKQVAVEEEFEAVLGKDSFAGHLATLHRAVRDLETHQISKSWEADSCPY